MIAARTIQQEPALDYSRNQRFVELLDELKSRRIVYNDADFAARVHVNRSYISELKNNKRKLTEQFVRSICHEFHFISSEWLLSGEGHMMEGDPSTSLSYKTGCGGMNERIKRLIQNENLTYSGFAEKIEVSENSLKSMFNRNTAPSYDTLGKIASVYRHYSLDWLLLGEGEMLKEEPAIITQIHHPKSVERIEEDWKIPLYDVEAAANLKTLFDNRDQNIIDIISIPNAPKCDGAMYVRGDSMYPLLNTGDIVAYKQFPVESPYIIFGEVYIVSIDLDGDEYLTIKRIHRSERGDDWIKLVSEDSDLHNPQDFPISSIRAIALVKFSIRMHTMK